MTERDIQSALFREFAHGRKHRPVVPNAYFYRWESDLLSVTRAGYAHVCEIKVTRSDFFADFKKEHGGRWRPLTRRHEMLAAGNPACPSYFWFAVPYGLVEPDEVPEYAGLFYIPTKTAKPWPKVVREAPRRNRTKLTEKQIVSLYEKMHWRYWNHVAA